MASPGVVQTCSCPLIIATAVIGICAIVFFLCRRRSRKADAHIPVFKEDVVYLFQFPAFDTVPCPSPFALKVETWLRLHKIPYEVIRGTEKWSKQGQIPFIELNGEEICDSNIIIQKLKKKFEVDDKLEASEHSIAHAFTVMLDNQTVWTYARFRFLERIRYFLHKCYFFNTVAKFLAFHLGPIKFRLQFYFHGIGRHTKEEIYQFGMEDIQALSDYLDSKSFILGERMTTVDCVAFAHLSQILWDGIDYPHKEYLEKQCPNLVAYLKRIKESVWPDWDQVCANRLHS